MDEFQGKVEIEYVDKTPKGEKLDRVVQATTNSFKRVMRSALQVAFLFAVVAPLLTYSVTNTPSSELYGELYGMSPMDTFGIYTGFTLLGGLCGMVIGSLFHFVKWVFS